jgi:hypothetical protein
MDQPERVRYFDQQFLRVDDFIAEQAYHREMRHRHNRMLHTPGVADGLQLVAAGTGVKVTPGSAVRGGTEANGGGLEILLAEESSQDLSSFDPGVDVHLTIAYEDVEARKKLDGGVEDFTRYRETAVIEAFTSDPTAGTITDPKQPHRVLLGRVTRGGQDGKQVLAIDMDSRRVAGSAESELSLTPRSPAVQEADWVRLRWAARGQAELRGSLRIQPGGPTAGDLSVAGSLSVAGRISANSLRIATTDADPPISNLLAGLLSFHFPGTGAGADARIVNDAPSRLSLQAAVVAVSTRLGVGISAPAHALHVAGNGMLNNLFAGDVGHGVPWAAISHRDAISQTSYALLTSSDGRSTYINKRSGLGTIEFRIDNSPRLVMDNSGNLTVSGDLALNGKHVMRGNDGWLRLNQDGAFANGVHVPGVLSTHGLNVGGQGGWDFKVPVGTALLSGRLGIGITAPLHALHSSGNALLGNVFIGDVGFGADWAGFSHRDAIGPASYALLTNPDGRSTFINKRSGPGTIEFRVDNSARLTMDDAGNLNVSGRLNASGDIALSGRHAFRGSDTFLRLNQDGAFPSGVHTPGLFSPLSLNVGGIGGWGVALPGGNAVIAGRLGVGTATPGYAAQVMGDVFVSGRLSTFGYSPNPRTPGWGGGIHTFDVEAEGTVWSRASVQTGNRDLAENFVCDIALEPGEVVALDPERDIIVRTRGAYDPLVLGVVSDAPGLLLGEPHHPPEGEILVPVGLAGRVPCKVLGPVNRGDLLCPSHEPGRAMRAEPVEIGGQPVYRPGTIIGKSLESSDAERATIDIIVLSR